MTRHFFLICVAASMLFTGACKRQTAETYIPDEGSLGFDIEPINGTAGRQFIATYSAQGKTAKFRIQFGEAKASTNSDARALNLQFGTGKFIAEPGSEASILLVDLKKALDGRTIPVKVQRTPELPFTYVTLGERMSQSAQSGFSEKPAGNWTLTKIFIEEDNQEGEVYLNYNPAIRKAQFSIKDPDYADFLMAQLAKVL